MAGNYIQEGKRIAHPPLGAGESKNAGALVLLGALACVALTNMDENQGGVLAAEGVFEVAGKKAEAIGQGAKLYWDPDGDPAGGTAGSGCLTTVSADGVYAGIAWADAASASPTVQIKLNA